VYRAVKRDSNHAKVQKGRQALRFNPEINPYKSSLRPVVVLITLIAGVLQYVFWFVAWAKWLGVLGVILGFILTSGVVIFPIIY